MRFPVDDETTRLRQQTVGVVTEGNAAGAVHAARGDAEVGIVYPLHAAVHLAAGSAVSQQEAIIGITQGLQTRCGNAGQPGARRVVGVGIGPCRGHHVVQKTASRAIVHRDCLPIGPGYAGQLLVEVISIDRLWRGDAGDGRWCVLVFLVDAVVVEHMRGPSGWRQAREVAVGVVGITDFPQIGQDLLFDAAERVVFEVCVPFYWCLFLLFWSPSFSRIS